MRESKFNSMNINQLKAELDSILSSDSMPEQERIASIDICYFILEQKEIDLLKQYM
jgi:hypothetical protein